LEILTKCEMVPSHRALVLELDGAEGRDALLPHGRFYPAAALVTPIVVILLFLFKLLFDADLSRGAVLDVSIQQRRGGRGPAVCRLPRPHGTCDARRHGRLIATASAVGGGQYGCGLVGVEAAVVEGSLGEAPG
jgi:hypothetical protein